MNKAQRAELQERILREFYNVLIEHREHMRSVQADVQMMRIAVTKAAYFRQAQPAKARKHGKR